MSPNGRGALYMVLGMAGFAIEDAFVKLTAARLPPGEIMVVLGFCGAILFALVARARGVRVWTRAALQPALLGRNVAEMIGTFGYVMAVAFSPLTTATAIFQATPLATTMGAALFLGEAVGWRRWLAIVAGFAGVLLVVRPGAEGFAPTSLFALFAVFALSARDLFTRRIARSTDSMLLTTWGFFAVGLVGLAQLGLSGGAAWPGGIEWAWLAGAIVAGSVGYWFLTESTRLGELAAIMPFRYARLLFALMLGVVLFGERPDALALLGMAVIVASGLYAFARERARAQGEALAAGLPQGTGPG